VRQFGTDRLEPIRTTYVSNGRITGRGQRAVNEREAMQIVDTIEKCCADPAYDDTSMGVITFLGSAQSRFISDVLLDPLGLRQRELECQGWTFWRVRGSQFFRDPDAALEELWDLLDRLGIEPEPPTTEVSVHEEVTAPDPVGRARLEVEAEPVASLPPFAAASDPVGPPTHAAASSGTQLHRHESPVVPAGAIAIGPASLARLREEAELIEDEFLRALDTALAGDARVRASISRDREKRNARLTARLDHLRATIDQAFEVSPDQLPTRAWPGAVVQYRDDKAGEILDAVLSEADLEDETYDRIGPSSPLGILLDGVQVGQRLSYIKPNGQPTVVDIIAVSD